MSDSKNYDLLLDTLNDNMNTGGELDTSDAFDYTVEEFLEEEYGDDGQYEADDVTAYVASINGGDRNAITKSVHGTKTLDLEVSMENGTPEVIGTIDGKEVGRSDYAFDIGFNVDKPNLDVNYEDVFMEVPVFDAAWGQYYPDEEKVGEVAVLSGEIALDAEVSIDTKEFIRENRDALAKAGFSMEKEADKEMI